MKIYTAYLIALVRPTSNSIRVYVKPSLVNRTLKVSAKSITEASEKAIAEAKKTLDTNWEISMIWPDFPQKTSEALR
jgi:hypothetical protein